MRRDCQPCLVQDDKSLARLTRIGFTQKTINEGWLQDLLHRSPDVLPVSEIDDSFAPLVSVGREVQCTDNLYVSPSGRITLVEAKLWRNPEATRQVVAQVLDYAKVLSRLSYNDFEAALRTAVPPAPVKEKSLYEVVCAAYPDEAVTEADFVDQVQRSLRDARFMMLVVGDGIRENVEGMVGLLHQQMRMLFTFGLVELQVYESPSLPGMLVVPQLVAHSTEVVRAVVRVEGGGTASLSLDLQEGGDKSPSRRMLTAEEFFSEVGDEGTVALFKRLLADFEEMGAYAAWRTKSVSIRVRDPGGGRQRCTLLLLYTDGLVRFGYLPWQLEQAGLDPQIGWRTLDAVAGMFDNVEVDRGNEALTRGLERAELEARYDDLVETVGAAINGILRTDR